MQAKDEDVHRLPSAYGRPRCKPGGCSGYAALCTPAAANSPDQAVGCRTYSCRSRADDVTGADCSSLAGSLAGDCSSFTGAVQSQSNLGGADNSTLSDAIGSQKPSSA